MATGFLTALLWKLLDMQQYFDFEIYNLTLGFVAAFLVNVLVSLATKRRHA